MYICGAVAVGRVARARRIVGCRWGGGPVVVSLCVCNLWHITICYDSMTIITTLTLLLSWFLLIITIWLLFVVFVVFVVFVFVFVVVVVVVVVLFMLSVILEFPTLGFVRLVLWMSIHVHPLCLDTIHVHVGFATIEAPIRPSDIYYIQCVW